MQAVGDNKLLDAKAQDICQVCHGDGEVPDVLKIAAETMIKFVPCLAPGCIGGRFFPIHDACNGKGCQECWNPSNYRYIQCDCGGDPNCHRCRGTIKLALCGRPLCPTCKGRGCKKCFGTGRLVKKCRVCKGTGKFKKIIVVTPESSIVTKKPCFACSGSGHKASAENGLFEAAGLTASEVKVALEKRNDEQKELVNVTGNAGSNVENGDHTE